VHMIGRIESVELYNVGSMRVNQRYESESTSPGRREIVDFYIGVS
jgi:hypothetical protein